MGKEASAEEVVQEIRRKTGRRFSAILSRRARIKPRTLQQRQRENLYVPRRLLPCLWRPGC